MLNDERSTAVPSFPNRAARRAAKFRTVLKGAALSAPFVAAEAFAQAAGGSGVAYGDLMNGAKGELNAAFTGGGPGLFALAGTVAGIGFLLRKVFGIG